MHSYNPPPFYQRAPLALAAVNGDISVENAADVARANGP